MHGTMLVVTGPMFAGKTEWLITSLCQRSLMGRKCTRPLVYAHLLDSERRGEEAALVSHTGSRYAAEWLGEERLRQLIADKKILADVIGKSDWVVLDEVQFFSRDVLVEFCGSVLERGTNLCVGGLSQDSFGKPFGGMGDMMAMADEVVMLKARCGVCLEKAGRTQRITSSEETILVGGTKDYEPRCSAHWSPKPINTR